MFRVPGLALGLIAALDIGIGRGSATQVQERRGGFFGLTYQRKRLEALQSLASCSKTR